MIVETPALKQQIRTAAEREERAFYESRAQTQWLADLAPLGTGPDNFLNELLGRPENERPLLVLVTGYPADDARVPAIDRKPLESVITFV